MGPSQDGASDGSRLYEEDLKGMAFLQRCWQKIRQEKVMMDIDHAVFKIHQVR